MNIFLTIIRDPIWQAIGVLFSVLALFLTISTPSPVNSELVIIKTQSVSFADYLLPRKFIKLNLQKSSQDLDGAIVDYYMVINKGSKPIMPTDYISPLTIQQKTGGKILLVDTCAQPSESISEKESTAASCKTGSFVSSTWKQQEGKWLQDPALLNPGEMFCVIVVKKPIGEPLIALAHWDGRIAGSNIVTYGTLDEYRKSLEKSITDYAETSIRLDGFGAYWFVALQITAFYATTLLARQAMWLHTQSNNPIWPSVIIMLLSTCTSEILVDIFIDQNSSALSVLVWPLISIHVLLIIYLLFRALRIRLLAVSTTPP